MIGALRDARRSIASRTSRAQAREGQERRSASASSTSRPAARRAPTEARPASAVAVGYAARSQAAFVDPRRHRSWQLLDDGRLELRPLPAKAAERRPDVARRHRPHRAASIARRSTTSAPTWDDQGLASAIRIGTRHRVVTVPSPGLIDGNTATWSPIALSSRSSRSSTTTCSAGRGQRRRVRRRCRDRAACTSSSARAAASRSSGSPIASSRSPAIMASTLVDARRRTGRARRRRRVCSCRAGSPRCARAGDGEPPSDEPG